jgi:hypothetical protein
MRRGIVVRDLLSSMLFGLDSFVLCVGLGVALRNWRLWFIQSTLFGLADGIAGFLGSSLATSVPAMREVSPVLIASYGVIVLLLLGRSRLPFTGRCAMIGLPLLFSLDNLFAGVILVDTGRSAAAEAFAMASVTTTETFVGCCVGGLMMSRWLIPLRLLLGTTALTSALIMTVS